ncbi:hypothetical protein [Tsukamurella ocularis]|uniref:hypothetical protein n=1 Tax=Tsukamurella ocularis TaxID=1970234 RepID=UPI0021687FA2|nr:hypothetical protein [Tsukamurella ocularis]MCS3780635.1 hypothetical protein [Tsukamurella ocularis]MCS3786459.1 hypothetical protein [Tsukamurella ocularis]MCS3850301.1 hypothetical protein [Tsukamurella ocularis]
MWDIFDVQVFAIPVAVVLWIVYAVGAAKAGGRHRLVEVAGWAASIVTALAALPIVAFVVGFVLFLPALWFMRVGTAGTVEVVAWAEAVILTVATVFLARWAYSRLGKARFLTATLVILALSSIWNGRWLATVDWFPAQS